MSTAAKGRPKSEEKKEAMLSAAADLFLENGYDGVSMDLVADRAGVSKQTVYSHFGNKDALFASCVTCKMEEYGLGPALLDHDLPAREGLSRIGQHFNALLLSPEAVRMKRLMCAHAESNPKLSELFYQAGPAMMKEIFADYLDRQVARGQLQIEDTALAARHFLYMIQGDAHMMALLNISEAPSAKETDRYVESCVELFMTVYGTKG